MSKAPFPDGIQPWPIEKWENGHQNFTHRFKKNASFKVTLPESKPTIEEKYKATTANFMWLIKNAIENKNTLRAMGNGWSFSDVAVCDGGAIDTKSLRLSFNLNNSFVAPEYLAQKDAKYLFFVQCGMSVLQVNEKLEASGRSLKASGASNGQSIAGATSTGTHGAAFNVGAVHDAIIGLHIITGPDKHVFIERRTNPVASNAFIQWLGAQKISDDELFNAALVSFGSFGIIHGVLLETFPIFLLEEHRSGEIAYDDDLIKAMTTLDFSPIQQYLPYGPGDPNKQLYHFEILVNPHEFERENKDKGVFLKTMYKEPYRNDYVRRARETKGFQYGDNTLGLLQTILDTLGPHLAAPLVPKLVGLLLPLAFKPAPAAFGTIGETFGNTKFRGKAASAAIAMDVADSSTVLEEIVAINKQFPFAGAISFRFVKGTTATLGFTRFAKSCVLEMDGVDADYSRKFFTKVWDRLEAMGIKFTFHWGKINFRLDEAFVRKMYSDAAVDTWIACRHLLLDTDTRKVFSNPFMKRCGLDV